MSVYIYICQTGELVYSGTFTICTLVLILKTDVIYVKSESADIKRKNNKYLNR